MQAPISPRVRREIVALAAILLAGLVLRFIYLGQVAALPFFDAPVGDSAAHLERARAIAAGALLPSRPSSPCRTCR